MQIIEVRTDELSHYIGHEIQHAEGWAVLVSVHPDPMQGRTLVLAGDIRLQSCFDATPFNVNASTYWGDSYWASQNVGLD